MKTKPLFGIGALMLALGVVFIACNDVFTSAKAVQLGGFLFILVGLVNLTMSVMARRASTEDDQVDKKGSTKFVLSMIVCDAAVLLGIVLIAFKDTFVPFIPVTFGLLALVGSALSFYQLAIGIRPIMLPAWMFVFPILLLADSVLIYFQNTPDDDATVMTLTGVAACLYGLCSLIAVYKIAAINRAADKAAKNAVQTDEIKSLNE